MSKIHQILLGLSSIIAIIFRNYEAIFQNILPRFGKTNKTGIKGNYIKIKPDKNNLKSIFEYIWVIFMSIIFTEYPIFDK